MNNKILFVGQCKQGSNSLFKLISDQPGFIVGQDIRPMVRSVNDNQPYFSAWSNVKETDVLLDKSIINPDLYDYHIGNWQNYNHQMIYMIRNIYKMLRSQFLVVLAGEESYEYNIPKFSKKWNVDEGFDERTVIEIMDYNKHKYTHYHNITNLPTDVFHKDKNIFFCTFEGFISDTDDQFDRLEEFLNIELNSRTYPKENSTRFEWYSDSIVMSKLSQQSGTYERNVELFNQHKDFIYDYCINKQEWEQLCYITGIDFISLYKI